MSERFKASVNVNDSKNTRLPVNEEFENYRFGRDALAHVSRYLLLCEELIEYAKKLGRPLRVIDIGCGDVYIARVLISSFAVRKSDVISRYVGVDIDDVSIKRTAESLPGKSIPIELVCTDITTGGLSQFADKEFDVLINTEVIEHIQPRFVPEVLREFKRISRFAYISTPNFTGGTGQLPEDHIKEWDCEELTAEMKAAGIDVKRRVGIFSNLNKVEKLAKTNPGIREKYDFLRDKMDGHFLSIAMARFIGIHAQNVMYVCDMGES